MTNRDRIENTARLYNYDLDQEDPGEFYIFNDLHEFHVLENSEDTYLVRPDYPDINLPEGLALAHLSRPTGEDLNLIARNGELREARLSTDEVITLLKLNEA